MVYCRYNIFIIVKEKPMFHKLHIQMTIFSALITSGILAVMTLACLFISERGIRQNSYVTFTNNANSCISHLETQSLLSHQWILRTKQNYGVEMEIRDNGQTLFFDRLNPDRGLQEKFAEAAQISRDTQGLDPDYTGSITLMKTSVFKTKEYYACTALLPKQDGVLSMIILYPLDRMKEQIREQRMAFGAMGLLAAGVLFVFSWFFTKKMVRPLEESRRKQTEFIASASHELRSPLAVILSSIQAMEGVPREDEARFYHVIKQEGSRMARLINDMLSLANADNHSWSVLKSSCELDTLVIDTYEKYEPLMKEKNLHFTVQIPDAEVRECACDASRIGQVLGILLDNAASYVSPGGSICLGLCTENKAFEIFVADNGPGIPDEDKESVFERFYRADTSRGSKQHFGLGLCIAREIIQLHHGTLKVADTPGGGATFTITLPG